MAEDEEQGIPPPRAPSIVRPVVEGSQGASHYVVPRAAKSPGGSSSSQSLGPVVLESAPKPPADPNSTKLTLPNPKTLILATIGAALLGGIIAAALLAAPAEQASSSLVLPNVTTASPTIIPSFSPNGSPGGDGPSPSASPNNVPTNEPDPDGPNPTETPTVNGSSSATPTKEPDPDGPNPTSTPTVDGSSSTSPTKEPDPDGPNPTSTPTVNISSSASPTKEPDPDGPNPTTSPSVNASQSASPSKEPDPDGPNPTITPTLSPSVTGATSSPTSTPIIPPETGSPSLTPSVDGDSSAPTNSPFTEFASPSSAPVFDGGTESPTAAPLDSTQTGQPTLAPSVDGETISPTSSPSEATASPTTAPSKDGDSSSPTSSPTVEGETNSPSVAPIVDGGSATPSIAPSLATSNAPTKAPKVGGSTHSPTASPSVDEQAKCPNNLTHYFVDVESYEPGDDDLLEPHGTIPDEELCVKSFSIGNGVPQGSCGVDDKEHLVVFDGLQYAPKSPRNAIDVNVLRYPNGSLAGYNIVGSLVSVSTDHGTAPDPAYEIFVNVTAKDRVWDPDPVDIKPGCLDPLVVGAYFGTLEGRIVGEISVREYKVCEVVMESKLPMFAQYGANSKNAKSGGSFWFCCIEEGNEDPTCSTYDFNFEWAICNGCPPLCIKNMQTYFEQGEGEWCRGAFAHKKWGFYNVNPPHGKSNFNALYLEGENDPAYAMNTTATSEGYTMTGKLVNYHDLYHSNPKMFRFELEVSGFLSLEACNAKYTAEFECPENWVCSCPHVSPHVCPYVDYESWEYYEYVSGYLIFKEADGWTEHDLEGTTWEENGGVVKCAISRRGEPANIGYSGNLHNSNYGFAVWVIIDPDCPMKGFGGDGDFNFDIVECLEDLEFYNPH